MTSKFALRSLRSMTALRVSSSNGLISKTFQPTTILSRLPQTTTSIKAYSTDSKSDAYSALTSFLKEEIKYEKENQKYKSKLPTIAGFDVQTDGPNVTLTRTHGNEKIVVKFSCNDSLNEETAPEGAEEKQEGVNIRSKPPFSVDIIKNNKTLSFECSYLSTEYGEDKPQSEDFELAAFAIHDGDWNDKVYTVDASIMDGDMYDILLNVLEERGIGEQFANQLMEFSTAYEHQLYLGLLDKLNEFAKH